MSLRYALTSAAQEKNLNPDIKKAFREAFEAGQFSIKDKKKESPLERVSYNIPIPGVVAFNDSLSIDDKARSTEFLPHEIHPFAKRVADKLSGKSIVKDRSKERKRENPEVESKAPVAKLSKPVHGKYTERYLMEFSGKAVSHSWYSPDDEKVMSEMRDRNRFTPKVENKRKLSAGPNTRHSGVPGKHDLHSIYRSNENMSSIKERAGQDAFLSKFVEISKKLQPSKTKGYTR